MERVVVFSLCLVLLQAWPLEQHKILSKSRIVNGSPARKDQFPWTVALYFHTPEVPNYEFFCGGAIIAKSWILTAAHCMHNMTSVRIQLGSNSLKSTDPQRLILNSNILIPHENFNHTYLTNDIGVVKIVPPLRLDPKDLHLMHIPVNAKPPGDGTNLTISGWGAISDRDKNLSQLLVYTELKSIPKSQCLEAYGPVVENDAFLCAVSTDGTVRATCSGDSGSPLVLNPHRFPVHVGVFSFYHIDGCESGKPSVFTRTDKYRQWIREKTGI